MKRGELWTVAGAGGYNGKPRPIVILQDEVFTTTESITICGLTSDPVAADLLRIRVQPSAENGLHEPSSIMVDKVSTVPRSKLGRRIGVLDPATMEALSHAIILFLGLIKTSREE